MDRSLHARPAIALPWRGHRAPQALSRLRAACARLLARRRVRIGLVCMLVAVPLLGGGWLWFRKSSFVSVQTVRVVGASGPQAPAIEAALRSAAHGMSTLDVDTAALRSAIAQFALVRGLHASAHFPHTLVITLDEELPVAELVVDGAHTAVAADGLVLGAAGVTAGLPTVSGHWQLQPGQTVHEDSVLADLTVLGAAPRALAAQVASVYASSHGVTVAMRNGLLVYFGTAERARAKWRALERVLLDEGSAGAGYVDVRSPERPAAGGFPEGTPPPVSSPGGEEAATTDPASEASVAALAEGLRANAPSTSSGSPVGANEPAGGGSAPSPGGTPSGSTTAEAQAAPSQEEASAASSAGGTGAGSGEAAAAPAESTTAGGGAAAPGG
ncbi:MAG TPA: cell division protein FtsQ/DivIB [Solirubrobacteraceae bacterium]|nr:cell division protein FtsQ/DivIB [Solirubrobacteraceae bacterium]